MTVEELIEELRRMPPTSLMEIETRDSFETPTAVRYEMAITTITCEWTEDKE